MLMLTIDQSTCAGAAALFEGADCLEETTWEAGGRDARLFTAVPELLQRHRIDTSALDAYVIGLGPGSFTGIRISLAYTTGLALPEAKPITGICSASAMAWDILPITQAGMVAVIGDARRGLVWIARFDASDPCRRLLDPIEMRPQNEVVEALRDALMVCSPDSERLAGRVGDMNIDPVTPSAQALGKLALARKEAGIPSEPLQPLYLHPPVVLSRP